MAAYIKEREGFESLITDEGFASYRILGEECYLKDIYVYPDYRKQGVASEIADEIAALAKKEGCKFLTGSVCTTAKNPTDSTAVLIAYGFKITATVQNGILFRKEI